VKDFDSDIQIRSAISMPLPTSLNMHQSVPAPKARPIKPATQAQKSEEISSALPITMKKQKEQLVEKRAQTSPKIMNHPPQNPSQSIVRVHIRNRILCGPMLHDWRLPTMKIKMEHLPISFLNPQKYQ